MSAAVLPLLEVKPREDGEKQTMRLSKIVIFKRDKMIGYLNDQMTRGVLWVRNEIKSPIVTIKPEEANGHVSVNLIWANTQLIPKIKNKKWIMKIKIGQKAMSWKTKPV